MTLLILSRDVMVKTLFDILRQVQCLQHVWHDVTCFAKQNLTGSKHNGSMVRRAITTLGY